MINKLQCIIDIVDNGLLDGEIIGQIMASSDKGLEKNLIYLKVREMTKAKLLDVFNFDLFKKCRNDILVNLSEEMLYGCDIGKEYGVQCEQEMNLDLIRSVMFVGSFDKDYNFIYMIPSTTIDDGAHQADGRIMVGLDFRYIAPNVGDGTVRLNADLLKLLLDSTDSNKYTVCVKMTIIEPLFKGDNKIGTVYHMFENYLDGSHNGMSTYRIDGEEEKSFNSRRIMHSDVIFDSGKGPFGF
ncbi:MAG: hypothetical protein ACRC92_26210 [Peptostreptococcaceae bacterium]